MKGFLGFPEGEVRSTHIPAPFFNDLLPSIDHLGELKITLYAFWLLGQKKEPFPYFRPAELAQDKLLREALAQGELSFDEALQEALERAVARGTLLTATIRMGDGEEAFYFLNSPKGQAALKAIEADEWRPSGDPDSPLELRLERPNIFNLYEQNIGPLSPMIAERLRDAERTYPEQWIEDAMRIAVENNVRKWRYIEAILEDWLARGVDDREDRGGTEKARRRYRQGKFADFWDS